MSMPALYTPDEAAAKLKVTRRAVYQWLADGRLKGLRVGQHWRIPEEELISFMRKGGKDVHLNAPVEDSSAASNRSDVPGPGKK